MQRTEMRDYVNKQPSHGQKCHRDLNQKERRIIQLVVCSIGVLCVIQAILNVSLRLAWHSNKESVHPNCNTTNFSDKNECNKLMQRIVALTKDRALLEKRNTELHNMIKTVEEESERLKMLLSDLSGCESSQQCPAGWREINSRCYFLSRESKTWQESRRYCRSKGADLVVINSEQEQRALYRLNGEAVLLVWIGLSDVDGTFKWVDGSPLTKTFWESGQPNPNDNEDCVEMYHLNPELSNWNDAPCGKQQRWLCEKDPCSV